MKVWLCLRFLHTVAAAPTNNVPSHKISVNLVSLRRSYTAVMSLADGDCAVETSFLNAIVSTLETLSVPATFTETKWKYSPLNALIAITELPLLQNPLFLEGVLPPLVRLVARLSADIRIVLARFFSQYDYDKLKELVTMLHQFIAFTIVIEDYSARSQKKVNDDENVRCAVTMMEVLYTASVLGGKFCHHYTATSADTSSESMVVDKPADAVSPLASASASGSSRDQRRARRPATSLNQILNRMMRDLGQEAAEEEVDRHVQGPPLLDALGIDVRYCRKPIIPFNEFYSDPLSASIDFPHDYMAFRAPDEGDFSFMSRPFMLSPSLKVQGLVVDNSLRMRQERRQMLVMMHQMMEMGHHLHDSPFLRLRVRRDFLVIDTLTLVRI